MKQTSYRKVSGFHQRDRTSYNDSVGQQSQTIYRTQFH